MLIAQLTDTHVADPAHDERLYADNNGRLDAAVASLTSENPAADLVLLTGDTTNNGRPAEFELLAEALAPIEVPILAIPGNHDTREGVRSVFPNLPWADAEHASWVVDEGSLRIIGLDTTVPGEHGAAFDDERSAWLANAISGATGRCVIAMHHPPFVTGIDWMDRSGFEGREEFAAVLAELPVERILCGHLHRPIQSSIAGIPAQVAPSTIYHVDLELTPGASPSIILDPPGYLIHRVTGDSWVTHTRYFDTGEERVFPDWGDD